MGWLVVVQVALSVVLIVAAGVFIRSFMSLANRTLGLVPSQVLVVTLDPQRANIDPAQRLRLYQRALEAVRGLPNVAHAAISHLTPVGGGGMRSLLRCHRLYFSTSSGTAGRGPTSDISPLTTFHN